MRLARKIVIGIGFALAATLCEPVLSQRQPLPRPPYSLDEAVALVKEKVGGRVIRAQTVQRHGRTVHEVRVFTDDGRVRTIDVDARNGIER